MLKRLSVVLAAILFVLSLSATHANAGEVLDNMGAKFRRGLVNTFTGWSEFPLQTYKGFNQGFKGNENHKVLGVATGALEGIFAAVGRTASGVADVIGFWALSPESNEGIGLPMESRNAWEEGETYDLLDPTCEEATIGPVGNKIKRGLGNAVGGIVEVPGQIVKGFKEGSALMGPIKGIQHFLSREISGLHDLVTAFCPSPRTVVGNTFEEEWPWTAWCENVKCKK